METAVLPLNYSPIWRRREDSNLRYGIAVQQFSKLPPSTTRSLLHCGGSGWTRTSEDRSRLIYSQVQLPLCDTPIYNFRWKNRTSILGFKDRCPTIKRNGSIGVSGRSRTYYAMLFRHALYQLSYRGKFPLRESNSHRWRQKPVSYR